MPKSKATNMVLDATAVLVGLLYVASYYVPDVNIPAPAVLALIALLLGREIPSRFR